MRALVCRTHDSVPLGALGPPLARAGIEVVVWRTGADPAPASLDGFAAVIALGGTANPGEEGGHPWLREEQRLLEEALDRRLPALGICLGAQLLAQAAGGTAYRRARPEIGWYERPGTPAARHDPVYRRLPERPHVLEWHAYGFSLPGGATLLSGTEAAVEACRVGERAWALQYHLEVDAPIVAGWIARYGEEVRALGEDPRAVARETARHAAANVRRATAFGAAFADVVRAAAGTPAPAASGAG